MQLANLCYFIRIRRRKQHFFSDLQKRCFCWKFTL